MAKFFSEEDLVEPSCSNVDLPLIRTVVSDIGKITGNRSGWMGKTLSGLTCSIFYVADMVQGHGFFFLISQINQ